MCDLCGATTFCQLNVCSDCKSSINNMEQNFNSLQQLKAEILPLITDALDEFADRKFDRGEYYLKQAIAKLSAV